MSEGAHVTTWGETWYIHGHTATAISDTLKQHSPFTRRFAYFANFTHTSQNRIQVSGKLYLISQVTEHESHSLFTVQAAMDATRRTDST